MTDAETERAAIVEWLRAEADRISANSPAIIRTREQYANVRIAGTFSRTADAIERGDHTTPENSHEQ